MGPYTDTLADHGFNDPDPEIWQKMAARHGVAILVEPASGEPTAFDTRGEPSPPSTLHGQIRASRTAADGTRVTFYWKLWSFGDSHVPLMGGLLVMVIAVVGSAFWFLHRQLKPLAWLHTGVDAVARGDFKTRVPVMRDDEIGQVAEAFNVMASRVGEMIDDRERLLADVSHELRSPIARMKVALEFMPEGDKRDALARDLREMENLIAVLLEREELRSRTGRLEGEDVDLDAIAREVVATFADQGPGVELVSDGAVTIHADPSLMKLLIQNLVDNAVKFSRPDSRPAVVKLETEADQVLLRVIDDGIGIPTGTEQQLFEPFVKVDRARGHGVGYGIGLNLCQRIAQLHGGTIRLRRREPRGTEVVVTLPRRQPQKGDSMRTVLSAFSLVLLAMSSLLAQPARPKQNAIETAASMDSRVHELSMQLWELSETALLEKRSAELLASALEDEGFQVERGVSQMPTAFVATWGSGRPIVGILAEYDALPGVGNEAVPELARREDGVTSGHGCGHNLFGPASVVGAIAAKRTLEAMGASGTVRLYGTPAEETVVGKVYMARDGLFDDLDVALDWHPGTETRTRNQTGLAMNNFFVEFFGRAAHGARDPWNGRSALDAVELMNHGANLMREHIEPTARIHYVIPSGGEAPNVVPAYAKVWYYVRDLEREAVEGYYARLLKIAEGAALATGTTHKVTLVTGVHECLLLRPLQEAIQANLELIGGPQHDDAEQEFARQLQRFLDIDEEGYVGKVEPLADTVQPTTGGSSDVCEVSRIVPEGGFRVTTAAAGIPWHSWASTACHGTSAGVKGAQVAARVLAATAIDLLTDEELLQGVRAEFQSATEDAPYRSPIPADQPPPKPPN